MPERGVWRRWTISGKVNVKLEFVEGMDDVAGKDKRRRVHVQSATEVAMSDGTIPSNGIPNITPRFTGSGGLDDEVLKSMSVKLPKPDKKKLEGYVARLVEEKQKTDRKTIDGLIQEVDRLTALLPKPEPEDEQEEATGRLDDKEEEEKEGMAVEPVEQRRSVGLVQSRYNFTHIFLGFALGSAVATS